jgi:hypothetical protein
MPNPKGDYGPEEIAAIGGWLAEHLTATEIARRFSERYRHVTRSAICGIVHRTPALKDLHRRRRPAPSKARIGARSVADAIAGRNAPVAPVAPGAPRAGVPLAALEARECRFPVGQDARGHLFCAAAVSPADWAPGRVNGSYCACHRAILRAGTSVAEDVAPAERAHARGFKFGVRARMGAA